MAFPTRFAIVLVTSSVAVAACDHILFSPVDQCKQCQDDLKACNAAAEKKYTDPILVAKEKDSCNAWFKSCADFIQGLTCSASLDQDQDRPTRFASAPLMSTPASSNERGEVNLASVAIAILRDPKAQILPIAGDVSCRYVCDQSSPLCTKLDGGNSYFAQLVALQSLVSNAKDHVAKSDIMAVFGETDDPCERTDIFIADGRFENRGAGECTALGSLSFLGLNNGSEVPVQLTFPDVMRGDIVRDSQGIGARFDPETAPSILLNDDPAQVLSGPVSSIELYKEAILIEVGGACILTSTDG